MHSGYGWEQVACYYKCDPSGSSLELFYCMMLIQHMHAYICITLHMQLQLVHTEETIILYVAVNLRFDFISVTYRK